MTTDTDARPRGVSRRHLFRTAGAGVAAAAGTPLAAATASAQTAPPPLEALESLSAAQADILEVICARLIPSDDAGPGAFEARAAHYIDRALSGPLRASRDAYAAGLAAVDAWAQHTRGAAFVALAPADQDAVLADVENDVATGFMPSAAAFFALVRTHTLQGTFCDPCYGGNAGFVGWDLIGYPGVRLSVGPEDQRLTKPSAERRSAWAEPMFARGGGKAKGAGHDH